MIISPKSKPKILFVLPSLVPGGAERVMSYISQNLHADTFDVSMIITGNCTPNSYEMGSVPVRFLGFQRVLFSIPKLFKILKKEKPDIVISSITHLNIAISLISPFLKRTKFIGREASILSHRLTKKTRSFSSIILKYLINSRYKTLDAIVCQSQDMAIDLERNFHVPKDKLIIINNPISRDAKLKDERAIVDIYHFITVGRLVNVKGYDRLLDILSKFNKNFTYTIIGDGPQKEELFIKAKELGILKNIMHIPFTNDIDSFLSNCDLFLQGSYVEGFPNALLESCVVGTPVLAFDALGGTKEIIDNGVNGFLVSSEGEFLSILNEFTSFDPEIVRNSVIQKFNSQNILQKYERLFLNILEMNTPE